MKKMHAARGNSCSLACCRNAFNDCLQRNRRENRAIDRTFCVWLGSDVRHSGATFFDLCRAQLLHSGFGGKIVHSTLSNLVRSCLQNSVGWVSCCLIIDVKGGRSIGKLRVDMRWLGLANVWAMAASLPTAFYFLTLSLDQAYFSI